MNWFHYDTYDVRDTRGGTGVAIKRWHNYPALHSLVGMFSRIQGAFCITLLVAMAAVGWAAEPGQNRQSPSDLTNASLEDLMSIEITSVSKREQKLSTAPSAIYVITAEDIRRSGATSIPEALRMAPGLSVARMDKDHWAISARGFNDRFANKMLVLIDGRTVYTPTFSGVYWDVQDTLLEDVDRIEVIRGPGATLWGANAVNGVINIITKPARDTQGGLVEGGGGFEERGFGGARYGGKLGRDGYYRVYGKYFTRGSLANRSGHLVPGDWDILRGGFRADWKASDRDALTFQGDIYNGNSAVQQSSLVSLSPPFNQVVDNNTDISGGNVLARWTRTFSGQSSMVLQLYHDRTSRVDAEGDATTRGEIVRTSDIDFQHHFAIGQRQDLVWGLGYRHIHDISQNSFSTAFIPEKATSHLFSAFVQDEFLLVRDRLRLTLGSKIESSRYSRHEIQPGVRLLWTPADHHTIWAAVSRAARTPARGDWDLRRTSSPTVGPDGVTNLRVQFGSRNFKSEELRAYELGYRVQPGRQISFDIATFYNAYKHLQTNEPDAPFFEDSPLPPHWVLPRYQDNKMRGETYGVEVAANWNATSRWKLSAGYTWLRMHLIPDASSQDLSSVTDQGNNPNHQVQLRSYFKLFNNLECDTTLYYVEHLVNHSIPTYTRIDARLGWHPVERLEISISAQNLLDTIHREFFNGGSSGSRIKRSMYGKVTWRF